MLCIIYATIGFLRYEVGVGSIKSLDRNIKYIYEIDILDLHYTFIVPLSTIGKCFSQQKSRR